MNTPGFSLLEVLLSLVILSVGLLGLLKLQTSAMQYAYTALLRTQGQVQLLNIAQTLILPAPTSGFDWQKSNELYLPQSQSRVAANQVNLVWTVYGQPERLSLQIQ